MGNLIQSIPVYKPVQQPVQVQKNPVTNAVNPAPFDKGPFADAPKYTYQPARPLSPGTTAPKGARPLAASGTLVKENIFQSAGSTVSSYVDYFKYFYNAAFKGEGNDYKVGKINDLAIRAGSLGIAGVLATSKMFPFAKGMEFVGLGTWFAAMALWPRVLGVPIQMKTGVNINQRYIDSAQKRKMVYEDNQYRPMDLFRHVDLNGRPLKPEEYYKKYDHDFVYLEKMGDKLGIPRDIKNRNEATLNKMYQVGTQGRTLLMLTAGVVTPVVSSIVADSLQKPLKTFLEKQRYDKAVNELHTLDTNVESLIKSNTTNIDKVMEKLGITIDSDMDSKLKQVVKDDKHYSTQEFDKLSRFLSDEFNGTGFNEAIKDALKANATMGEPHIGVTENLKGELTVLSKNIVQDFLKDIPAEKKSALPQELLNFNGISREKVAEVITNTLGDVRSELNTQGITALKNNFIVAVRQELNSINFANPKVKASFLRNMDNVLDAKTDAFVQTKRRYIIPKSEILKIIKIAQTNKKLSAKLEAFQRTSIKNISESMTANNWGNVPPKYLKAIGFTKGELAVIATQDSAAASAVIAKRLEQVVAEPQKYEKVLEELTKLASSAVTKEEKAVLEMLGTTNKPGTLFKVKELMMKISQKELRISQEKEIGSMDAVLARHYNARIADVRRKYRNTIDSFAKPIKTLEVYKHIKNSVKDILAPNEDAYYKMIGEDINSRKNQFYPFHNMSYKDAMETVEKYLKNALVEKNDIAVWTTKFEHALPGHARGMKDSLTLVRRMSIAMYGDLIPDTVSKMKNPEFAAKVNVNNSVMRARYIRLENELAEAFSFESKNYDHKFRGYKYGSKWNYMTDYNFFGGIVDDFVNGNTSQYNKLCALLEERLTDLSEEEFKNCRTVLNDIKNNKHRQPGYDLASARNLLFQKLDFKSSNKSLCEMAGKDITDMFMQGAQDIRARNQWTKLVYGLLIGAGAVSALTIALIGKKNHFNKDIYEPLDVQQGAGN